MFLIEKNGMKLGQDRLGKKIKTQLTLILALALGGCATTQQVTRTTGQVERLMTMPEYEQVRSSSPEIKRWAREALTSVNDLEYQVRNK